MLSALVGAAAMVGLSALVDWLNKKAAVADGLTADEVMRYTSQIANAARKKGADTLRKVSAQLTPILQTSGYNIPASLMSSFVKEQKQAKEKLNEVEQTVEEVNRTADTLERVGSEASYAGATAAKAAMWKGGSIDTMVKNLSAVEAKL